MAMEGTIKVEPESYEEDDESTFSIDISETMSLVEMERRCVKQEVDDDGKHGGGKVAPGGSVEARGSVDDNDPSRKEAVEKARKWLENYLGIKNRKAGRPKKKAKATNPNPLSFECPVCLLMFQSEGVLAKHISFCANLKLFKCRTPHCDKTFRNSSQARLHYQRCHLSR